MDAYIKLRKAGLLKPGGDMDSRGKGKITPQVEAVLNFVFGNTLKQSNYTVTAPMFVF